MINLQKEYKEIYANDKKDLLELIQEWIDENILDICCKCEHTELKCQQSR